MTKFTYTFTNGKVVRQSAYSFTPSESLAQRIQDTDNLDAIKAIADRTIQGEKERSLIEIENKWFLLQSELQEMDETRLELIDKRDAGDAGAPWSELILKKMNKQIADLAPGETIMNKEFYDHYTRKKQIVKEVIKTSYQKVMTARDELEALHSWLKTYRGVTGGTARPAVIPATTTDTIKSIKKEVTRQEIAITVGDDKDLMADISNALAALIKKSNGTALTEAENQAILKYVNRQSTIVKIVDTTYKA